MNKATLTTLAPAGYPHLQAVTKIELYWPQDWQTVVNQQIPLTSDKAVDPISSKWMRNFDPNFQSSTWFPSVNGSVNSNARNGDFTSLINDKVMINDDDKMTLFNKKN
uniref:Uncharacterized protein n=1 Tax=Glossina pallidipes TaxID=7398 RepID=A0A1B0AEG5_GLOPL